MPRQANAKQRKGRAGRVRPGQVYKLYTRQKEETLSEYMMPEMLRSGCILCINPCRGSGFNEVPGSVSGFAIPIWI
jgi:hypothetical protein